MVDVVALADGVTVPCVVSVVTGDAIASLLLDGLRGCVLRESISRPRGGGEKKQKEHAKKKT